MYAVEAEYGHPLQIITSDGTDATYAALTPDAARKFANALHCAIDIATTGGP